MSRQTTDHPDLRQRVTTIVTHVLGEKYRPDKSRLEMTSLQMLELVVALEDEFNIHISEDAPLAKITSSLESILKYLQTATRDPRSAR